MWTARACSGATFRKVFRTGTRSTATLQNGSRKEYSPSSPACSGGSYGRRKAGVAEPSACVIDAQSVKTSTSVHAKSQGIDAGKKIVGRKRSIITDTLGLLLAVLVTAAGVQDSAAGQTLLDQTAAAHPTIRKVWVDGGYRKHFLEYAATLGIDLEIVQRSPGTKGFTPIPKRWTVERTYGWLMLHRRLARDYETLPERSEAMIHLAMTDLMARRREHHLLARPDINRPSPHHGMKQRAKTTSYNAGARENRGGVPGGEPERHRGQPKSRRLADAPD